ncbi:DUF1538 domain-containing protein [Treponema brennaborense]|uniref:DUF1538 domain-containing protein n=1 Tax=Treponema brennaborense (strain DSM 12168 / CIP 105900 / DD5/3) TaxID=906968 RepID=F4LNH0_TREBD|nr:DUF1538 domain-containing protein [Treponema brennaborense]AEE17928.1 protein of unknown function DUF1538 [Treponema brennaborense DSM 12168]
MNLLVKFRETLYSVVPIMVIVLILGCTVAPLGGVLIARFVIGGVLLIVGLTVFLLGVDLGILPIGEAAGSALVKKRSLPLLLSVAFVTGFLVTAAEPDVQVLAGQIQSVSPAVHKFALVMMISAGIGLFVMIGLLRTVLALPLNVVLCISYAIVFICAYFTPPEFLAVAFDSGGATTGPMTVPFIMALGVGVAAVRARDNDSFGLIGIVSVGPIFAVLLFGIYTGPSGAENAAAAASAEEVEGLGIFLRLLPEVFKEVTYALLPLIALFAVFQLTLIKMPPYRFAKIIKGLIYSFIGLIIFLVGVKGGFMLAGSSLGRILGGYVAAEANGALYEALIIGVGVVLGAVVVCAEPAVWVLTDQVETVSGGTVKRRFLLVALSAGVAVSVGLSMVRILAGFSIWWYLIPGYALALAMSFFCPKLFTAIAFDSGGVASGPMTSTFVLSFTLGISSACGGNPVTDAFGVIALVALTPLIAIQTVGLLYRNSLRKIGGAA